VEKTVTAQRPTTTTIAILGANTVVEKVLALLLEFFAMQLDCPAS
jgi:hypothetical protein